MNAAGQAEHPPPGGQPLQADDLYRKAHSKDQKEHEDDKDVHKKKEHSEGTTMKIIKAVTGKLDKGAEKLNCKKKKHHHDSDSDVDDEGKHHHHEKENHHEPEAEEKPIPPDDELVKQEEKRLLDSKNFEGGNFIAGDQFPTAKAEHDTTKDAKPEPQATKDQGPVEKPENLEAETKEVTNEGGKTVEKSYADAGVHRFDAEKDTPEGKPEQAGHGIPKDKEPKDPVQPDRGAPEKKNLTDKKEDPEACKRSHFTNLVTPAEDEKTATGKLDNDASKKPSVDQQLQEEQRSPQSKTSDTHDVGVQATGAPQRTTENMSMKDDSENRKTDSSTVTSNQGTEGSKRADENVRDVNVGGDMRDVKHEGVKSDTKTDTMTEGPGREGDAEGESAMPPGKLDDEKLFGVSNEKGKEALKKTDQIDETTGDQFAEKNIEEMNAKYANSKKTNIKNEAKAAGVEIDEGGRVEAPRRDEGGHQRHSDTKTDQPASKDQNTEKIATVPETSDNENEAPRKEAVMEAKGTPEEEPRREKLAEAVDKENKREELSDEKSTSDQKDNKENKRKEPSDGSLSPEQIKEEQDKMSSIIQKIGMKPDAKFD